MKEILKLKLKVNLRKVIKDNGYSVTKFAQVISLRQETLSRIINEANNDVSGISMFKISRELNMSIEDIWIIEPSEP